MATADDSVLTGATEALARLAEVDLDELCDAELTDAVLQCQRLRGALEAAEARVLARWDARRVWRADGAKNAAGWLACRERLPIQTARQRMRHARALRTLPDIEAAWANGEIDRTHVTTLLAACTPRTKDAFATEHKDLLDSARTEWFRSFKRHCDIWEATVDPDGAEQDADDDYAAREVHLSQSFGGMWFGRATLDPISGTIVHGTLALIERQLFDTDWARAKQRLGREPTVLELDRTPAQRRADALVEMAIRARTAPPGGRRPAPLFTVLVDYPTLTGPVLELFNGTVISPGTAARHLTHADVERIVFDTPSRVIDVGAQRRFFRGALRRAIEIRDRTCFHPMCDEVPERPHIDHIQEARHGGPTTQHNGRLGCDFHNLLRNTHPDHWDADTDPAAPHPDDPHAGPDPPDH
jgi:hypothetical protein